MDPKLSSLSRRSLIAGAAAGLVGTMSARPAAAQVSALGLSRINARARQFLSAHYAPGFSMAISRGGQVLFEGAFGGADEAGGPLTTRHRLRIGSLSKVITATAIMMLVERQWLGLEDRVFGPGSLLGDRFGPTSGPVRQIRVSHLLGHTAGGWSNQGPDPLFFLTEGTSHDAISWTLANVPLSTMPGVRQAYSNMGYAILGRIIEQVTGESYEAWVRDNLLARAGAGGMYIGEATPGPGESRYLSRTPALPYSISPRRLDSGGGWVGTARELINLMLRIDGFAGVPDLISPSSARYMGTAFMNGSNFGPGWIVNRQFGNWWHNGILPGASSVMATTHDGWCFALLANGGDAQVPLWQPLEVMAGDIIRAVPEWQSLPTLRRFQN